jgi:hypothetical protein
LAPLPVPVPVAQVREISGIARLMPESVTLVFGRDWDIQYVKALVRSEFGISHNIQVNLSGV